MGLGRICTQREKMCTQREGVGSPAPAILATDATAARYAGESSVSSVAVDRRWT
jgi:hypothetical protein